MDMQRGTDLIHLRSWDSPSVPQRSSRKLSMLASSPRAFLRILRTDSGMYSRIWRTVRSSGRPWKNGIEYRALEVAVGAFTS